MTDPQNDQPLSVQDLIDSPGEASVLLEAMGETVRDGLLILDRELRVLSANASFYRLFDLTREDTEGRRVYALPGGPWNLPDLHDLLEQHLAENTLCIDYEVTLESATDSQRSLKINARRVDDLDVILLAVEDCTELKRSELALRDLTSTLEAQVLARTRQAHALAQRLTLAEQAERTRIARVLHDELQQLLYGLNIHLSLLRTATSVGERDTVHTRAANALEEASRVVRTLSSELSPPVLDHDTIADILHWLARHMAAQYDLTVDVDIEESVEVQEEGLRVLLYHALRELLFNVVKHAEVDRVCVAAWEDAGVVYARVEDEGRGFDPASLLTGDATGLGLAGILGRVEVLEGNVEIDSVPGRGTRVTIALPTTRAGDE